MENQIENVKTDEDNTEFAVVTEVTEESVVNEVLDHEYVALEVIEELDCTCNEDPKLCPVHQARLIQSISRGEMSRWDFFIRVSKYIARCKRCAKLYSHKSSTGNLLAHLKKCYEKLPLIGKGRRGYTVDRPPPIEAGKINSPVVPSVHRPKRKHKQETHNLRTRVMFQKYFERYVPFRARCRLCPTTLSYKTTTAHLYKHLEYKHEICLRYNKNDNLVEVYKSNRYSDCDNEDMDTDIEVKKKMKVECNCDFEQTNMHSNDCPVLNDQSYKNNYSKDNTMTDEDSNDDFTWEETEEIQMDNEDNTKSNVMKSQCNKCGHTDKHVHYATCPLVKSESHQNNLKQVSQSLWKKSEKNPLEEIYVEDDRNDDDDITIFTIENDNKTTHYSKVKGSGATVNSESTSKRDWDASIDNFSAYIGSLLKLLPRPKVVKLQASMIDTLLKEQMKPS